MGEKRKRDKKERKTEREVGEIKREREKEREVHK